VNRQTKRQMAKSGTDGQARGTARRPPVQARERERTSPTQFFSEVRGEMRKVAWPGRPEVINSTLVVLVAVIFMGSAIFALDWLSAHFVLYLFG
jgi:preprotein translocase subunit SecE